MMPLIVKYNSGFQTEKITHQEYSVMMTALKLYRIGTWEKITEWIYRNKLHKKKGWFK